MRRGRQFVTGRGTKPQELVRPATVVSGGPGIPRAEREKPGGNRSRSGVPAGQSKPLRGWNRSGDGVTGRDEPGPRRRQGVGRRLKDQRVNAHREAA